MKRLWLFYPQNDVALAADVANFTAPAAAIALQRSGMALPLWMCGDGDRVVSAGINDAWLSGMQAEMGLRGNVWNHDPTGLVPTPWGWSKASRAVFAREGFTADTLPGDRALERMRLLSHRRTTAAVGALLKDSGPVDLYPPAAEVATADEIAALIPPGGKAVVKSPWSSSGRGVKIVELPLRTGGIEGTIRRQGSVMVERFVEDAFDFALLYRMEAGTARFEGYSVFATEGSVYRGNAVGSSEILREMICRRVDSRDLDLLVPAIASALETCIATGYEGPLGVDMLADAGGRLHLSEINLRYTMGFVALALARHVEGVGHFAIERGDTSAECRWKARNGRLVEGRLPLTPPGGDFSFELRV